MHCAKCRSGSDGALGLETKKWNGKRGRRTVLDLSSVACSKQAAFDVQRLNFQSNTTVYLLWMGNMFRPLFGLSSGKCMIHLQTKVKIYIKYGLRLADLTITNISRNMNLAIINMQLC